MNTQRRYAIAYCFSCRREVAVEYGHEMVVCPICDEAYQSILIDKYPVSEDAALVLMQADRAFNNRRFDDAATLYRAAIAFEETNPYAHLGAALADFEVVFDRRGTPISCKKTKKKFESDGHFVRACELLKDTMRGEYYADLGAKIGGLNSGLDVKALEKLGFEYLGTRLDRYNGKAEEVDIEAGTTHINALAFAFCKGVKRVHIPASVTAVERMAFTAGLDEITVDPNNKRYMTECGCLIDRRTGKLVYACDGASIGDSVKIIGSKAFDSNKKLCAVDIPEGVTTIENGAFDGCTEMTHVSIPSTVTKIERGAFVNCYKLADITVDGGNAEYYAETGCLIERKSGMLVFGAIGCKIPNGVKKIGAAAFGGDHKSLHFPASVKSGIDEAFCGCDVIEELTVDQGNKIYYSAGNCIIERKSGTLVRGCARSIIPDDGSVKKIGKSAFSCSKKLKKIVVPRGVTEIGFFAFDLCTGLREIELPDTLERIDSYAFSMCDAFKDFRIPSGVKTLGTGVFDGCKNLETLFIPASVCAIYGWTVMSCEKLKTVIFEDKTGWTVNDAPLAPEKLDEENAAETIDTDAVLKKETCGAEDGEQ